MWGDDAPRNELERRKRAVRLLKSNPDFNPENGLSFLAISGGAQEGAFGAGLLAGWSASGSRPEFHMVSGISSGAMLAPFAFLGPEYDLVSHALFSEYDTKSVVDTRYASMIFRGASLSKNEKLYKILTTHFTPVEMEKVAAEYRTGRRLFIGTTNLDYARPVIWDLGAIAASGHPDAYEQIIKVLMASAAFPGVFPPILFDVEQDGERWQEMHVDGGLTSQVFAYALNSDLKSALKELGIKGNANMYVLRNAVIWPRVKEVEPKNIPILLQTAFSMVNSMALKDMHYLYLNSLDNGLDFKLAYIPSDFRLPGEMYDPSYMKDLYTLAYKKAENGYPWEPEPPEFANEKAGE